MKVCGRCKIKKTKDCFGMDKNRKDGLNCVCKECIHEYYVKNKNRIKEKVKEYREKEENKDKIREYKRKYHKREEYRINKKIYSKKYKHTKKGKISRRKYENCRLKRDINYRLRCIISSAVYTALKKQNEFKKSSILLKLPFTIQQLKQHLELQFESWMSWDNYGRYEEGKLKWNIDHIIPQSLLIYDSMDHPNFQKCWALENLQPLEVISNSIKGNKTNG